MIPKYPKLVRDKIPEIINTKNKKSQVKVLNINEYKKALKQKLVEESQEVLTAQESDLMEEIADVYEVIEALIFSHNLDKNKIAEIRENKANLKGKFKERLLLIAVENLEENNSIPDSETLILNSAEDFLKTEILPQAHLLDRNPDILKEKLNLMNRVNPDFLRLKLGKNLGGLGMSNKGFYSWQIMIAKYSGALSFLQTQHQSAMVMLAQSSAEIQHKYLSKILEENLFCGVGFSHLRRQGKPCLRAIPVKGGYELTGFVPWITGYGIFDYFIIGATMIDRTELYGILPFSPQQNLQFSSVMKLCAMNSTNTVTATLNQWFLSEEDVIMIKPANAIHEKDKKNVLHNGFFALGCAQGALEILRENCQKLQLTQVNDTYNQLKQEIEDLQVNMLTMVDNPDADFREKLSLRGKAINLAFRSSMAGIISSKGQANQDDNSANRYYREALVYSVSGQTIPVLQESLFLLGG
ncbi:acyl-CoA dehydrogenase family protein [Geminocystis herdmanii]|uniref:acyl-CoA dehydrogenase family protein n=1 Tax=Geminocystis herdmanii TaxID=669359 RepID=UPI00034A2B92|nr:acyl-CoA dehydrogenase family protein [Geminocystis herdmanii]